MRRNRGRNDYWFRDDLLFVFSRNRSHNFPTHSERRLINDKEGNNSRTMTEIKIVWEKHVGAWLEAVTIKASTSHSQDRKEVICQSKYDQGISSHNVYPRLQWIIPSSKEASARFMSILNALGITFFEGHSVRERANCHGLTHTPRDRQLSFLLRKARLHSVVTRHTWVQPDFN
jgi:hypothetical protein